MFFSNFWHFAKNHTRKTSVFRRKMVNSWFVRLFTLTGKHCYSPLANAKPRGHICTPKRTYFQDNEVIHTNNLFLEWRVMEVRVQVSH